MNDFHNQKSQIREPIDAVIAWVDGDDPSHRQRLKAYLSTLGTDLPASSVHTRFRQSGELEYCVASILKNASWVQHLYIVTDNQTPSFIRHGLPDALKDRISLIDHQVVFRGHEEALPVFSCRPIETVLWRIPGLASRFIYFNDDIMITHPVAPEDFFRKEGIVLRGAWKRLSEYTLAYRLKQTRLVRNLRNRNNVQRAGHTRMQELSAMAIGFDRRYFHIPHQPYNAFRETQERLFAEHPEWFRVNLQYKLRHEKQLWSFGLSTHDALKNKTAIMDNRLSSQLIKAEDSSCIRIKYLLNRVGKDKTRAFICIQGLDNTTPCKQKLILDWLDTHIGGIRGKP